jgi:hypothetical protein
MARVGTAMKAMARMEVANFIFEMREVWKLEEVIKNKRPSATWVGLEILGGETS